MAFNRELINRDSQRFLLVSLFTGIFFTPGLLFAIAASLADDVPMFFIVSTILENILLYHLLSYIIVRRFGYAIAFLLIIMHSFIVGLDFSLFTLMGTPLTDELLLSGIAALYSGVKTVTDVNSFFPIGLSTTIIGELFVLYCFVIRPAKTESDVYLPIGTSATPHVRRKPGLVFRICLFMSVVVVSMFSYSPIFNFLKSAYSAALLPTSKFYTVPTFDSIVVPNFRPVKPKANLVFILNESLGNIYFRTPKGAAASPFLQETFGKESVYNFKNVRPVSANTRTATPGLLTGYFVGGKPNSKEESDFYSALNLIGMAKAMNYSTVLFSSYPTKYQGVYSELQSIFDQFDHIISLTTLNSPVKNDIGMDDRELTTHILEHLDSLDDQKPFMIVIIWNNLHAPFLVEENFNYLDYGEDYRLSKALNAVSILDKISRQVYEKLESKNLLDNTILAFGSDHGETPSSVLKRVIKPDSRYYSVPLWFRIPERYLTDQEKNVLTANSDKLVSNLDVAITLIDILGWSNQDVMFNGQDGSSFPFPSNMVAPHLAHGQSLLRPIDDQRIVPMWQGLPVIKSCEYNVFALGNSTHNVIFKASKNRASIEEVDDFSKAVILNKQDWFDLPEYERQKWADEVRKYPNVLSSLNYCGFNLVKPAA